MTVPVEHVQTDDLATVNRRLRALIDIGLELAFVPGPERLLQRACSAARDLFGATYVTLGILAPDGRTVRHCLVCGEDGACIGQDSDWIKSGQAIGGLLESIVDGRRVIRGVNAGGLPTALQLPPDHPGIRAYLAAPIASGHHVYGWICVVKNGDDRASFTEADEYFIISLSAQVGRIYELEHEIIERRETHLALAYERDRAKRYLDAAEVIMLALDLDGRVTLINRKGCDLLERTEEELLGRDWISTCLPADCVASMRDTFGNLLAGDLSTVENNILTKSGAELTIEWRNTLLRDDTGRVTGTFSSGADITGRLALEQQFRQAQKMEAIGQLAGGVAHDFNNLLTVILGYCELLCTDLDGVDPRLADIKEIQRAGLSAAALTRQLLAFSRKEVIQPVFLDISAVVAEMRVMLQRVIGEDVAVVIGVGEPALILADRGQVEQVVMNLVVNARDAMPLGGTLTVRTGVAERTPIQAFPPDAANPGPFVLLSVEDTGSGMTAAVQARVFEPFFTTKEPGHGTGLGLATVQAIVARGGGTVHIDSAEGRGTTVTAYFPKVADGEMAAAAVPVTPPRPLEHATVLIVEDAEEVLALAATLLRRQGHTVLAARNGEEALQLFERAPGIDVILTDVVMPGWSGPELIRQLHARRRDLRVVYMSGSSQDAVVKRGELAPGVVFLHKPFTSASLAAKLREALDQGAAL